MPLWTTQGILILVWMQGFVDNGKFYLFGGTGNFSDLGGREDNMDNIMYGIVDPHYPLFKQLYDEDFLMERKTILKF